MREIIKVGKENRNKAKESITILVNTMHYTSICLEYTNLTIDGSTMFEVIR
jgi:hypothetical protein